MANSHIMGHIIMVVMDIIMIQIPVTKHDWSHRVDVLP